MFARFNENPAMTLQDIKETKRYGRTDERTHGRTDNVKTVYPLQTKLAGGIKSEGDIVMASIHPPVSYAISSLTIGRNSTKFVVQVTGMGPATAKKMALPLGPWRGVKR